MAPNVSHAKGVQTRMKSVARAEIIRRCGSDFISNEEMEQAIELYCSFGKTSGMSWERRWELNDAMAEYLIPRMKHQSEHSFSHWGLLSDA